MVDPGGRSPAAAFCPLAAAPISAAYHDKIPFTVGGARATGVSSRNI